MRPVAEAAGVLANQDAATLLERRRRTAIAAER
jgi:hypothetical protein